MAEICSLPMYDENREIVRGRKIDIPQAPNPWKISYTVDQPRSIRAEIALTDPGY